MHWRTYKEDTESLQAARERYPKNTLLNMGIAIARSHHERWDGEGYPYGLIAEDITLSAKIMAVADVYDALRSKRPYKAPMTHEKACEIILSGSGSQFDPDCVMAFMNIASTVERVWEELNSLT